MLARQVVQVLMGVLNIMLFKKTSLKEINPITGILLKLKEKKEVIKIPVKLQGIYNDTIIPIEGEILIPTLKYSLEGGYYRTAFMVERDNSAILSDEKFE